MANFYHKYYQGFRIIFILMLFTVSMLAGSLLLIFSSSNTLIGTSPVPLSTPPNAEFYTTDMPTTHPTYTGAGTSRTATEYLYGDTASLGLPSAGYANQVYLDFNLPGTGYWTGTRIELQVDQIFEQKDWTTNGDFEDTMPVLDGWTAYTDTPGHTGPDISISQPVDALGTHGRVSSFNFAAAGTISDIPPLCSSTTSNEGDVGANVEGHWSTGGNAAYTNGYAQTTTAARVAGNSPYGSNNRDGYWRMYVYDTESHAYTQYTIQYYSRYNFDMTDFPVSFATLSFAWRVWGSIDNAATGNCGDTDTREDVTLEYRVVTPLANTPYYPVYSWNSATDGWPFSDSGWQQTIAIDVSSLFASSFSGNSFVEFRLTSEIDVDDGMTWESYDCNHDVWCNYETCWHCVDRNNEDSDSIYVGIDAIELSASVPQTYGADVNPDIHQSITFNNRNATANTYIALDYKIPSSFLTGKTADNNLYLDVLVNGGLHRFSIKNQLTSDGQWHTIVITWGGSAPFGGLGTNIGINPGPTTITIEVSVVFTLAGWYAQGVGQSIEIDEVVLWVENYAPADLAQLNCYDMEHGGAPIVWSTTSESTNTLALDSTWQTVTDTSRFWLNSSSSAAIWMSTITATFYADYHYPSVTPYFSSPTDGDGLTDTVTWTITYNVQAIASGWRYYLTIPNIPDWETDDWDVVSIKDPTNADINYSEISTGGGMKNISIYETDEDTTGNWVITCTSPNKITDFDVQDQSGSTKYVYYPGGASASRINFSTAVRESASSQIWVNYTNHLGAAVSGTYPDATILPNTVNTMAYWNIPNDATPNDHYLAMVKWVDTDSFNDEVGFAAHYVQIKRNITTTGVGLLQQYSLSSSNIILAGEVLRFSVNITDPLVSPCLALDLATLVIDYPDIGNPQIIQQKTLTLQKSGNMYYYELHTDGDAPDSWLITDAWMGGVGNRTFTINLFGNSTYINGLFENYQIQGWFQIVVDLQYTSIPTFTSWEQGKTFDLTVRLEDHTPAHIGSTESKEVNNRSVGTAEQITDLDGDGYADTWNGSIKMHWNIIWDNLSAWCDGIENINNPINKWNGTLEQDPLENNIYTTKIKIPYDATPTVGLEKYYINITTNISDNTWGWQFEYLYMTLALDSGPDPTDDYDDHKACVTLGVIEAQGYPTKLYRDPTNSPSTPSQFYWRDESANITRLYIQYTNQTNGVGFNSTLLNAIVSSGGYYYVKSWVDDNPNLPEATFGRNADGKRLNWTLVNSSTNLPNGQPDPHRENLSDPTTWGWFYCDFNWTTANLGPGTFPTSYFDTSTSLGPIGFSIYIETRIYNLTNAYKINDITHYIEVKPNSINQSITLEDPLNRKTFLDTNYYSGPGEIPDYKYYYYGDILNFTIDATDQINSIVMSGINYRFYVYSEDGTLLTWGTMPEMAGIPGRYSARLNTSDPAHGLSADTYDVFFRGIKANYSVIPLTHQSMDLNVRKIWMRGLNITGVYIADSINDYTDIDDIRAFNELRPFDDTVPKRSCPNEIIKFNVSLFDVTERAYKPDNVIRDANVSIIFRESISQVIRYQTWVNICDLNGYYHFTLNLSQLQAPFDWTQFGWEFELEVIPQRPNFQSQDLIHYTYLEQEIIIDKRPIAIIPESTTYYQTQSNWRFNPIRVYAIDLITGENISGCEIDFAILPLGDEFMGTFKEVIGEPGVYETIFDVWNPDINVFRWVAGGHYTLSASIKYVPGVNTLQEYATFYDGWAIASIERSDEVIHLNVESEGFLGPLTMYFWIIAGCVGAVVGAYYSYKSYKFLTTPYVIRKIDETVDKISKDKKIAAGVMKSRDHLVFLEATEILQIVGVALKPPPAKKLPPPIEKLTFKKPIEEVEKLPEIPIDVISEELDKVGVRPEEKPILLTQIQELELQDRQEFVESLIGEERYKEIVEKLKLQSKPSKENPK